ncbi:MAG: aldo/keto reductase [Spirochaetales bacterium]|nr:MAG: aldo/keto reductase [Spirochaetales bacterium]
MKKRILGRTGLEVSELSFGAAFVTAGDEGSRGAPPLIREVLDSGINLIDTSADYGQSEAGVGEGLREENRPVILCTKIGPRDKTFNPRSKKNLRKTVEESLRLLGRESIDILMIHEPDRPAQIDWWDDLRSFRGPVVDLLTELKDEGIIRFTGLGGTTAYEIVPLIATGFYDVLLTAFNYSMLWREAELEVIPEAKKQNMGIMLGSPTQQGWLAHRYDDQLQSANLRQINTPRKRQLLELYKLVDKTGIPIPELSLRWALMNSDSATVLTGAKKISQLRQNVKAAGDGPLSREIMGRIDEIAAMVPFRPFEEPFLCPFYNPEFDLIKRPGPAVRFER